MIALKINGVALDSLPVTHVLKILNQQLVFDWHVVKHTEIKIKVHKDIFLHPCVRYSNTGNGNELSNDRRVGLLCLFLQPCKEGVFIVLKDLSPILIFFQLLRHCLYNFLLFRVSKDKRYFPVLCNVVYRFHLQIGFCRLQQNVVFFACWQSRLHISLL